MCLIWRYQAVCVDVLRSAAIGMPMLTGRKPTIRQSAFIRNTPGQCCPVYMLDMSSDHKNNTGLI